MVLGDPAVGKTSLIRRYIHNTFQEGYISTLGVDFLVKDIVTRDESLVRFVLWDVAGQSKYANFKRHYYQSANFIIIVFDVTNIRTCWNVQKWLYDAQHILGKDIGFVFIANKIDLYKPPISFYDSLFHLAEENRHAFVDFVETSAKTGKNVEKVFTHIAEFLKERAT